MKKLLTLIFLLSVLLFGASFDCAKAKTNIEKMICTDPELSALDENLSKIFIKALKISKYKNALKTQQILWIKERDKCDEDIDCVINVYRDRLGVFDHSYKLYERPPIPLSKVPYKLIVNQNDDLCKPLLELYNQDIKKVQKIDYDSHQEFNWLQWKEYVKKRDDTELIGGAFFDLNGDGKGEFIFGWYAHIRNFPTEDYMIFDNNVSDFFRHSPTFGNFAKWPLTALDFNNLGSGARGGSNLFIGELDYSLLRKNFNRMPTDLAMTIEKEERRQKKLQNDIPGYGRMLGWIPISQLNEVRFLEWQDGRIYLVIEGSRRFLDRKQFNLVGKVNQDYSFDTQCLFYKKNK